MTASFTNGGTFSAARLAALNSTYTQQVNIGPGLNGSTLTSGAYGGMWSLPNNPLTVDKDGSVELTGSKADIIINGVSLTDTLKQIQDRLEILVPNKELEEKWNALAELGRQYRELEQKLLERENLINILESD